jgi:competence protein ComEA
MPFPPPARGRVAPDLRAAALRRLRGLLGVADEEVDDDLVQASREPGGDPSDAAADEATAPGPARRARFGLDGRAALVLALVALGAVVLGGVLLWRARPSGVDVGPAAAYLARGAPSSPSIGTPGDSIGETPAPAAVLVIDVQGRVRSPGVVRLPAGSRVLDALRAAGGPRAGTGTTSLNLARPLLDGEQVVLAPDGANPGPAAGGSAAGGSAAAGPVDLNTATLPDLDSLPGVGPVLAQRILDFRAEHGRFTAVEELGEVPGIGPAKFAALKAKVRV